MKILITGSQGFIGSYVCQELLNHDYQVVGIDNYSKYGYLKRPQDTHENFTFYEYDVKTDDYFQAVEIEPARYNNCWRRYDSRNIIFSQIWI